MCATPLLLTTPDIHTTCSRCGGSTSWPRSTMQAHPMCLRIGCQPGLRSPASRSVHGGRCCCACTRICTWLHAFAAVQRCSCGLSHICPICHQLGWFALKGLLHSLLTVWHTPDATMQFSVLRPFLQPLISDGLFTGQYQVRSWALDMQGLAGDWSMSGVLLRDRSTAWEYWRHVGSFPMLSISPPGALF
jgi:hypothetical protein